jgi:hypothetical protein
MVTQALIQLERLAAGYDNGDVPPTFTLTLTESEVDYLHELLEDEIVMYGADIPEIQSLLLRVKRLKGIDLHVVN